jgi:uncharacterized protein
MAISCARCGRQYDVTLFQFGRTINCVCGMRVGFEHRLNLPRGEEIKFFADVMIARVVRLLRAVGIDTAWQDSISDKDLVRRAIEENRFVLTLDKRLLDEWCVDNVLLLKSANSFEQFREIVTHFKIRRPKDLFTRCLICNTPLRDAEKKEILDNAPPEVRENQNNFQYCSNCDKIYWEGSHTHRMRAVIEELFNCPDAYLA